MGVWKTLYAFLHLANYFMWKSICVSERERERNESVQNKNINHQKYNLDQPSLTKNL